MAVTRDGIPVRVWCWPGNTSDSPLIRQVKDELRDWTLGKVIWVADRGFTSHAEPPPPGRRRGRLHPGEKLRSGSPEAAAALARQGRYQEVSANLRVKEVKVVRARAVRGLPQPRRRRPRRRRPRERLVDRLEAMIDGSDRLSARPNGPSCAG